MLPSVHLGPLDQTASTNVAVLPSECLGPLGQTASTRVAELPSVHLGPLGQTAFTSKAKNHLASQVAAICYKDNN